MVNFNSVNGNKYFYVYPEKKAGGSLWICGKPFTTPVDKVLKKKKHFFNTLSTGSVSVSGLPHTQEARRLIFFLKKIKRLKK